MMLRLLRRLRRRPDAAVPGSPAGAVPARTAEHWDRWQSERNVSSAAWVDWSDHPTILSLLQHELFGSPQTTLFAVLRAYGPPLTGARALSLCSGDGAFERLLVAEGVFASVVGTDLSPVRVQQANDRRGEYARCLEFRRLDVNSGDFGDAAFDVVIAKAALHHVENLEAMFDGVRRCLRPGGRLVAIDYFGPRRFQWSQAQLDAANAFLAEEVPDALLRRPDGSLHRDIGRPGIDEMIAIDPSEAVRSDEVLPLLERHFVIERDYPVGGALLNLVFDGTVVNNFDPCDEVHNEIIRKVFRRERELMARGALGCDFRVVIAA